MTLINNLDKKFFNFGNRDFLGVEQVSEILKVVVKTSDETVDNDSNFSK